MAVTTKNLEPVHTRTGRACIDWNMSTLAKEAGLSLSVVLKFESGRGAGENTKQAMIDALEAEGVKLYNGGQPGARLLRAKDK